MNGIEIKDDNFPIVEIWVNNSNFDMMECLNKATLLCSRAVKFDVILYSNCKYVFTDEERNQAIAWMSIMLPLFKKLLRKISVVNVKNYVQEIIKLLPITELRKRLEFHETMEDAINWIEN